MRRMSYRLLHALRPPLLAASIALGLLALGLAAPWHGPLIVPPRGPLAEQRPLPFPRLAPPSVTPPTDCTVEACVALTFDDGPDPITTPRILDTLQRHQARATFFVVGLHVPGNEPLLRRMYQEGHEIGNHSWNHANFTTLTPTQIDDQINRTQAAVAAAGVPAPTIFRPPYGATDPMVAAHVPLTFALWNVDPEDWSKKHPPDVTKSVMDSIRPGRVVVLHDTHPQTADALDQLVVDLQNNHYKLVTFSELFDLPPNQRGFFYGR